jgi:phosphoribosylformylglycinamidine cyclo-ligase
MVEKKSVVTGSGIRPGDALIGLPSSGVHSNGLTLARKIVEANGLRMRSKVKGLRRTIGMELLEPTAIYVEQVMGLLREFDVRGMANITGGGLRNLLRLKSGVGFEISDPVGPNPVFGALQRLGGVTDQEMYQTFNMGMGFALVVPEKQAQDAAKRAGKGAKVVGHVVNKAGVVVPSLGIGYTRY